MFTYRGISLPSVRVVEVPRVRPLKTREQWALAEFERAMRDETIPQNILERERLAHVSRQRLLG